MENVKKHRNIKIATTETKRNFLASEPDCHVTNFLSEIY